MMATAREHLTNNWFPMLAVGFMIITIVYTFSRLYATQNFITTIERHLDKQDAEMQKALDTQIEILTILRKTHP